MKYIAVILSAYIMVLTAMPCNDVQTANTNSVSLELVKQSPNQSNDVDLCSPFCFCHSCQTLSFPSFFSISFINLVVITLDIKLKEPALSSPVASIWQPPKI
ncbi:DUF6660 family protein [Sunxiuqinia dokdonensis]|uniref:DUF6660 family protein n=1 Tax=Sunxiuqinia dokdonensis TaxID=1409788 RepID=UPI0012F9587D|nr:DUF6660 family protein [Sunxiuqinia dokdonensis]